MAAVSECTVGAHIANSVKGDRISSSTAKQKEVVGAFVKSNDVSVSSEALPSQQIFQDRQKHTEKKPHLTSYDDSGYRAYSSRCVHNCGLIMYRPHQIDIPGSHEKMASRPRP